MRGFLVKDSNCPQQCQLKKSGAADAQGIAAEIPQKIAEGNF
jgi:hypothetical protein